MKAVIKNIKNNYLLILTTILPILDILSYFFVDSKYNIITTIIRVCIVLLFFIASFIISKNKKKYYIFILILLFYSLAHMISCNLNGYMNFIIDMENLFRIMYMPILLFSFIDLFNNNKNYEKQITKGMKNAFFIIIISLILSILTNTCNYTYPNNIGITGWFYNKNSQSLIISILSFILATYSLEKNKYYYILPVIFLLLYFNATKAAYICLLLLLVFLILNLLKKNNTKKLIYTTIFLILSLSLFNFSPTNKNLLAYNETQDINNNLNTEIIDNEQSNQNNENTTSEKGNNELDAYKNIYLKYNFSPIIEMFGFEKVLDKYQYTKNSFILSNNRTKKKKVANLIYEEENIVSHLFGFEYTKISTIKNQNTIISYDLENDITALFYYCGWIGVILYFGFILYFITKILNILLKKPKYVLKPEYMVWLLLIFLMIFGSEFSGDLLRRPNANIYVSIIIATAYTKFINIKKDKGNSGNRKKTIKILNKIYNKEKEVYYDLLKKDLKNKKKRFIITLNPETLMISEKDNELKKMLLDKNVSLVPDGIAVVKAARKIGNNVKERITGIEIAEELIKKANEKGYSLYLFGAKEEVLKTFVTKVKEEYPNIKLLGATNGYENNKDQTMEEIINLKPDIVLVAMGIPLQEKLIYNHIKNAKKGIYVGVGGSFDVLSGKKKRAPKIFIKLNLEWLYRILKEPKRIIRFYNNNIKFIVKTYKLKKKQN